MSISEICKDIFSFYNKQYDYNEEQEEEIFNNVKKSIDGESPETQNSIREKIDSEYERLILSSKIKNTVDTFDENEESIRNNISDPVEIKILENKNKDFIVTTDTNTEEFCGKICKTFISDKLFAKKVIDLRIAEIKLKVMHIKYFVNYYQFTIVSLLYLKFRKDSGNVDNNNIVSQDEIDYLHQEKEKANDFLIDSISNMEEEILNVTICKLKFLLKYGSELINPLFF
jgi:hypothetical protein